MKGELGKHKAEVTTSEEILLFKVTHISHSFRRGTGTKPAVPMILVHNTSNNRVLSHHNRREDFNFTFISPSVRYRHLQESDSSRGLFLLCMAL